MLRPNAHWFVRHDVTDYKMENQLWVIGAYSRSLKVIMKLDVQFYYEINKIWASLY